MKRRRLSPQAAVHRAARALAARAEPSLRGADIAELRALLRAAPKAPRAPEVRWQDALIEEEIPRGASVLDLGCGGGELLARLIKDKGVRGQGIEIDADAVVRCVALDVPVLQADLDEGLPDFPAGSFDYVVLEETLQTLRRPIRVLEDMLRVGRYGIVSFPNFAYWRVRLSLALEGRMPITENLPYQWYDTPNIHLFSLQDFLDWAAKAGVRVVRGHALVENRIRPLAADDNLKAAEALLVITRS